ncbi:hypothetical protein [Nocardia brasiliensis]|uniref:hypothetical protein n=1 Tax=Nocardia brasiliensis TaxID=37326 RepID=UPI00245782D6|nr:hypothetical protein [Nocardia brasiliensis]
MPDQELTDDSPAQALVAGEANLVIVDGDKIKLIWPSPAFKVTPDEITLKGTSPNWKINGKKVCVVGDEATAMTAVGKFQYTALGFTATPGQGTITVTVVPGANTTVQTFNGGKSVLIKGAQFQAAYTGSPAMSDAKPPATGPLPPPGPFAQFADLQNKKVTAK